MDVQRRNVLVVATDGAIIGLMSAAASFVSVFVIRLGASALWVSLLSSIPSTIALVMTIPWSTVCRAEDAPAARFAWARLAVHAVYPLVAIVPFFLPGPAAAVDRHHLVPLALPSSLSNMMFTLVMGNAVPPRPTRLSDEPSLDRSGRRQAGRAAPGQPADRARGLSLGYQIAFGINAVHRPAGLFLRQPARGPERSRSARARTPPAAGARARAGARGLASQSLF